MLPAVVVLLVAENINLVIDPSNLGFKVGSFEGTLYLEIEDESILVRPYNALKYTITADENTFIVTVENEDDTYTVESDFIFLRYDSGSGQLVPVSDLTFDSIEITSQGTNEFTSVGSYRLNLSATAQGYTNVAFRENYNFVISPREISVSEGMFDKVYDGTTFKEVTITEGVLEGDNVIVRGIYSDANAGTNKTVRLTLAGDSSRNYTLTTASTLGTISKKDATISLVQNSFQYGEISANSNLSFEVSYQDEQGEKVYVSSGLYSITNQTIDFEGSGYLPYSENAYTVNIVVESQNYNITPSSLTFNIEKRRLDFTFNSPGVYMASYGSTETLSNTFIRSYTTSYGDTIEIEFVVTLPNCLHRFGYGDNTYNFGNFYPVASIYENGEFRQDNYGSNGDPFYSECADYDVSISYPSNYMLASSGQLMEESTEENITTSGCKSIYFEKK